MILHYIISIPVEHESKIGHCVGNQSTACVLQESQIIDGFIYVPFYALNERFS